MPSARCTTQSRGRSLPPRELVENSARPGTKANERLTASISIKTEDVIHDWSIIAIRRVGCLSSVREGRGCKRRSDRRPGHLPAHLPELPFQRNWGEQGRPQPLECCWAPGRVCTGLRVFRSDKGQQRCLDHILTRHLPCGSSRRHSWCQDVLQGITSGQGSQRRHRLSGNIKMSVLQG